MFAGIKIYNQRQGDTLAASSTFYLLLTFVPLTLLALRLLGIFFQDVIVIFDSVFSLAAKFFPELAPQILFRVKDLVRAAFYTKKGYTIINIVILFWSSLAFFNSLWRGVANIGKSPELMQWKMYFRGVVIISLSVTVFSLVLIMPPIFQAALVFIQKNTIMKFMIESFPLVEQFLRPFLNFKLSKNFLIKSNLASFTLFYIYLVFIYRWMLNFKIGPKEAIYSVLVFLGGLFAAKQLFWLYLKYVREGLVRNYGDYYTLILGLIWIYFIMSLFYFSLSIAQAFIEQKKCCRLLKIELK